VLLPFILYHDLDLLFYVSMFQSSVTQSHDESAYLYGFDEARCEPSMYLNDGSDHLERSVPRVPRHIEPFVPRGFLASS